MVANVGEWFNGTIEESWCEGVPYGIRLSDNRLVGCCVDTDECIRAEGTYDDITISDGNEASKRSLEEAELEGEDGEAMKKLKGTGDEYDHNHTHDHHNHEHAHKHKHVKGFL